MGWAPAEAVLKKVKDRNCWEGFIDEENGILPHEVLGLQAGLQCHKPRTNRQQPPAPLQLGVSEGEEEEGGHGSSSWQCVSRLGLGLGLGLGLN